MVHRRADSKINFFLIFTVHEEVGRKQYKNKILGQNQNHIRNLGDLQSDISQHISGNITTKYDRLLKNCTFFQNCKWKACFSSL